MMRILKLLVLVTILTAQLSVAKAQSTSDLLEQIALKDREARSVAYTMLMERAEQNPSVIDDVVKVILEKCAAIPVIPNDRREYRQLVKKHDIRTVEDYGALIIRSIEKQPNLASKLSPLYESDNQLVQLMAINIAKKIGHLAKPYEQNIITFMQSPALGEYASKEFLKDGNRALKGMGSSKSVKTGDQFIGNPIQQEAGGAVASDQRALIQASKAELAQAIKNGQKDKAGEILNTLIASIAEQTGTAPESIEAAFDAKVESEVIRSIISQIEKINAAANVFRNRFNGLPGDISNVMNSFNRDAFPHMADGNGNRLLDTHSEQRQFWHHLVAGELMSADSIECSDLSPECAESTRSMARIPYIGFKTFKESAIYQAKQNAGFPVKYAGHMGIFADGGRNYMMAGARSEAGKLLPAAAFTPKQAQTLDAKMDDGRPETGIVRVIGSKEDCVNENSGYAVESDQISCALKFRLSF